MFDFDEIEEDVSRKGAHAWAESHKDSSKLQEQAARKAEEVARSAGAVKPARYAPRARPPPEGPQKPAAPARAATAAREGPAAGQEVEELVGGSLRAVVWRPPPREEGEEEEEPRRPAVVICAGNPAPALGSSHMGAPLVLALFDAAALAGFPVLRFDYRGVGRNARGGNAEEWQVPTPSESAEDAVSAARWALEHLSDRIVIAGYSYGTSMSLAVLMAGLAAAFVSLSCGTEQWRMFEGEESARRKEDQVRHSRVTVPAIYVCGENDWITNQSELRRILAARQDGGAAVQVETVPGAKHELLGREAAAARLAADWLQLWWRGTPP